MNCKLLAILTAVTLILWVLLLYMVNMDKIRNIKGQFTNNFIEKFANDLGKDPEVLNHQMSKLEENYELIDEINSNLDTNARKLNMLNSKTNELNKVAYMFKYITIISISMLIFMICIFILNFDHLKGPHAMAKSKASAFFKKLKMKKSKGFI
jgi:hypothetical protein